MQHFLAELFIFNQQILNSRFILLFNYNKLLSLRNDLLLHLPLVLIILLQPFHTRLQQQIFRVQNIGFILQKPVLRAGVLAEPHGHVVDEELLFR